MDVLLVLIELFLKIRGGIQLTSPLENEIKLVTEVTSVGFINGNIPGN